MAGCGLRFDMLGILAAAWRAARRPAQSQDFSAQ
jgi:hypothetical protein